MVLQFNKGLVCKAKFSYVFSNAQVGQNVDPLNGHAILREDTVYLYPHPMFSNPLGPLLYHKLQKIDDKSYDVHDGLILTYTHYKAFQMHQNFQGENRIQDKVRPVYDECSMTAFFPTIYIPMMIFTKAIMFPSINERDVDKPFTLFGKSRQSWNILSPSWVSSKLYYINCSSSGSNASNALDIPLSKTLKTCDALKVTNINREICLFSPRLFFKERQKTFILSITLFQIANLYLNSIIGTLVVGNVQNYFCTESKKYIKFDYFEPFRSIEENNVIINMIDPLNVTIPSECAELEITYIIHPTFFRANNTHSVQILVTSFQYAELQLSENFLNLAVQNNMTVHYKWESVKVTTFYSVFENSYKIFFSKDDNLLSWIDALTLCNRHNMTLPTFTTKTYLSDMLSFVNYKYGFQPVAIFTGLYRHVSRYSS